MLRNNPKPLKFASCVADIPVNPNLAMRPSDIAELTAHGKSVNLQNLSGMYFDGTPYPPDECDLSDQRGVDICELWNAEKTARKKLSKLQSAKADTNVLKS